MEKSIEERAYIAIGHPLPKEHSMHVYERLTHEEQMFKNGYIKGAKEQKAIDDEQLPLIKETYYNAGYETAKNKMIDKACEWLRKQYPPYMEYDLIIDAMLEDFKKAMEE